MKILIVISTSLLTLCSANITETPQNEVVLTKADSQCCLDLEFFIPDVLDMDFGTPVATLEVAQPLANGLGPVNTRKNDVELRNKGPTLPDYVLT
jgi:hypothetical protein